MHDTLFSGFDLGGLALDSRIVMAPMTRSRAPHNVPNALMAEYYAQRASAALIVSEGIAPSANGLGYARIPGLFDGEQVKGWKQVTDAVHAAGGKIFAQLMHVGRVAHPLNLPSGGEIVAPSAVSAGGEMYTDQKGPMPHPEPRAMTLSDVAQAKDEFVKASRNAIEAGFDGVELHAANGYLLEQFLNPGTNKRTDAYGGSTAARNRFLIEVTQAVGDAIGNRRVGVRLSPHSGFNDMPTYDGVRAQYVGLVTAFQTQGVAYVHLVGSGADDEPETQAAIRAAFTGPIILNGGFDAGRAEQVLSEGKAALVAFGRPFVSNPDLVARMKRGQALADPDYDKLYTPGAEGYTDYPVAEG
ncbi:MAG: alkene reductase [Nannocystaceae bacterium]|nr:alkene reductase [Nannocystaceae bacterium]